MTAFGIIGALLTISGATVIFTAFSFRDWARRISRAHPGEDPQCGSQNPAFAAGAILFCSGMALDTGLRWSAAGWVILLGLTCLHVARTLRSSRCHDRF